MGNNLETILKILGVVGGLPLVTVAGVLIKRRSRKEKDLSFTELVQAVAKKTVEDQVERQDELEERMKKMARQIEGLKTYVFQDVRWHHENNSSGHINIPESLYE